MRCASGSVAAMSVVPAMTRRPASLVRVEMRVSAVPIDHPAMVATMVVMVVPSRRRMKV